MVLKENRLDFYSIKPLTGPNTEFWPIKKNKQIVGKVTSAVYSPRLEMNIALAMVKSSFSTIGTCRSQYWWKT